MCKLAGVKLSCCGSAQMIMKSDFQQIIIFKNTKQNLTINFPVESVFALSHAFGSRTLILHTAELLGEMQIVIVLFILTVMHRPLNYHAIEISSFYSNCFKESYIWESKKAFGRNTNEKNEERRIIKET